MLVRQHGDFTQQLIRAPRISPSRSVSLSFCWHPRSFHYRFLKGLCYRLQFQLDIMRLKPARSPPSMACKAQDHMLLLIKCHMVSEKTHENLQGVCLVSYKLMQRHDDPLRTWSTPTPQGLQVSQVYSFLSAFSKPRRLFRRPRQKALPDPL